MCGGVFSNVKINQKISEINFIKSLTVHPGMTDCGLSVGAALDVSKPNIRKIPKDYYLGSEADYDEIEELVLKNKGKFLITCQNNISKVAANSLSNKKLLLDLMVDRIWSKSTRYIGLYYIMLAIEVLTIG